MQAWRVVWSLAVAVLAALPDAVSNAALPCKPWNDDARLIKHDLMARLMAERAPAAASHAHAQARHPDRNKWATDTDRPSFDLAIVTSSRPRDLAMTYFGVTAGSLVGQGVYTGVIRVAYNGAANDSWYIERAASLLEFRHRLLIQRLPTDVLRRAATLDTNEPVTSTATTPPRPEVDWGGLVNSRTPMGVCVCVPPHCCYSMYAKVLQFW